jgi:hypothetical protein
MRVPNNINDAAQIVRAPSLSSCVLLGLRCVQKKLPSTGRKTHYWAIENHRIPDEDISLKRRDFDASSITHAAPGLTPAHWSVLELNRGHPPTHSHLFASTPGSQLPMVQMYGFDIGSSSRVRSQP